MPDSGSQNFGRGAGDQKALGLQGLRVGRDGDALLPQAEDGAAQRQHPAHAPERAGEVQQHAVDLRIFRGGVQRLENLEKGRGRAPPERQARRPELLQGAREAHHQPEALPSGQRRPVEDAASGAGQVVPGPAGDLDRRVRHQDLRFLRPFR